MRLTAAQIGRKRKEWNPKILDQNIAVFSPKGAIKHFVIQKGEMRQGRATKSPVPDEYVVRTPVDLLRIQPLCKAGHHRRSGARAAETVKASSRLGESLVDAQMGAAEGPASRRDKAPCLARNEPDETLDVGPILQRNMMMMANVRTLIKPCRCTRDRRRAILVNQNEAGGRCWMGRQRQFLGRVQAWRTGRAGSQQDGIRLTNTDPGPFTRFFIGDVDDDFGFRLQLVQPVKDRLVIDPKAGKTPVNVCTGDKLRARARVERLLQVPDKNR